jgi:prepilin-type N-terminal cleavage/methylation domain-containing protein
MNIQAKDILSLQKGFTLLEMVMVTAIIGILLAVVLTQERNFDSSTVLINTAYDVALSLRETQSLGLSSRNFSTTNNAGYGIYIGNSSNSYIQFADVYPAVGSESTSYTYNCPHSTSDSGTPAERPGDCLYETSPVNETVETYTLASGYTITGVGAYNHSGLWGYSVPGDATIDIVFERPNLQPLMNVQSRGTTSSTSKVAIKIASPNGTVECVVITRLGQIYVTPSSGCPTS